MSAAKKVKLTDSLFSAIATEGTNKDQLSDPFEVVANLTKHQKMKAPDRSKESSAETDTSIFQGRQDDNV